MHTPYIKIAQMRRLGFVVWAVYVDDHCIATMSSESGAMARAKQERIRLNSRVNK